MAGLILLISAGLRLTGCFNAFWLDEIISWDIARTCASPLEIFTSIHSDNNHHLNTLWIYLLGERRRWETYRLLSLLTGAASVAMMGVLAAKQSRAAGIIAMLLGGGSYFLAHYACEARGYAPAVFFALLCTWLTERFLQTRNRKYSLVMNACAILGVLSHLTFLYVLIGLMAWAFMTLYTREGLRTAVGQMLRLFGISGAFLIAFYILQASDLPPAGGPVYSKRRVVLEGFGWMLGTPMSGVVRSLAIPAAIGMVIAELALIARSRSTMGWFFITTIVIAPAAMLLIWKQPFVYPRYFVLAVPFFLILLAQVLARGWARGSMGRVGCVSVVVLMLTGNGLQFQRFFRDGRGHYADTLRFIASESGAASTVTGWPRPRIGLTTQFYLPRLDEAERVVFIARDEVAAPPQWIIADNVEHQPPAEQLNTPDGQTYRLRRSYLYYGLSGFDWHVYERVSE